MSEKRTPQAAYLEEYDEIRNAVKPDTVEQATRRRASSVRPQQKREVVSDSGYSSHHGAANANSRDAGAAANTSAARQSGRSKPIIIQRTNSQRAQQQQPVKPEPSAQNAERRYTLPKQNTPEQLAAYNAWYVAQAQQQNQSSQAGAPQYAQAPPAQGMPGTSARRPSISTQARPVSIHGYPPGAMTPHGPPPSPSAYQNFLASYYQNPQAYHQPYSHAYQAPLMYGNTPPTQPMPHYLPPSPVTQNTPNQVMPPTGPRPLYSARQANPAVPGYDWGVEHAQPGLRRAASTQQPQRHSIMPGAWDSSETDSDSIFDDSEEEKERNRRERKAKHDSRLMPPPPRRPSVHRNSVTVPEIPRTSREHLRRAPKSDGGAHDFSSSDNYSSDRTARAKVSHGRSRTDSTHSSRSRRPSVSTEGSRGTKQTSLSSGSSYQRVIVEDHRGKRVVYMSPEERDDLIRRMQRVKLNEEETLDRVEEYQRDVSGQQVPELTAENIRQATQRSQRRASGSHMSASGRSRRSGGSSKTSRTDGIEIKAGGTVLHVYGDAKIEMQASEDGGPARLVIGGSSRDSAYYGSSKGSGSRVSRRKQIIPEDGYEEAL